MTEKEATELMTLVIVEAIGAKPRARSRIQWIPGPVLEDVCETCGHPESLHKEDSACDCEIDGCDCTLDKRSGLLHDRIHPASGRLLSASPIRTVAGPHIVMARIPCELWP